MSGFLRLLFLRQRPEPEEPEPLSSDSPVADDPELREWAARRRAQHGGATPSSQPDSVPLSTEEQARQRLEQWKLKNPEQWAEIQAQVRARSDVHLEALRAERRQANAESLELPLVVRRTRAKFSEATKDGSCPACGGFSFKAKRSAGGKLAGGVLAPKTRVRCTTCGTEFHRG